MSDKISIIVPIYNAEKYLKKCISSVVNQTYKNWELILIDDLSEDKSEDICWEYCEDKRIEYIFLTYHIGIPGRIRNIGINKCTGDFITFLDADDWLEKDALEIMYNYHKTYNLDWVICNFRKIKNNEIEKRSDNQILHNEVFNENGIVDYALKTLDQQNKNVLFNYCWGRLYKTSIIRENDISFNEKLYTYEDIDFNFRYLKYVSALIYITETLYNYRIHDNLKSITLLPDFSNFYNYIWSLDTLYYFFIKYLDEKIVNRKIRNSLISLTIIQLVRAVVNTPKKIMINFYYELVENTYIRKSLKYYRPKKGESILIPILIFLKLKRLLYIVVKYKAKKRYL